METKRARIGPAAANAKDNADNAALGVLGRDRLARFFPALLGLAVASAAIEAAFAVILSAPALAAAAGSTSVLAIGVLGAGHLIRTGHPARARVSLAISLTVMVAIGAYLLPGMGGAMAVFPLVSVVLVLPHVPRHRVVPVCAAAVLSAVAILVLDELPHLFPPLGYAPETVFRDVILLGALVLVLAGLADFAMDARDSLGDLRESAQREIEASTERLAIVASLRTLHAQLTPEATATHIATALSDLSLVDVAVVLEATADGLSVLAAAGDETYPFQTGHRLPALRAIHMLDRSSEGAWSELWADRLVLGLDDDQLVAFGVAGQVFAPILAGDETVGLVGIVTTDRTQAIHLVSDLPAVREFAAAASCDSRVGC